MRSLLKVTETSMFTQPLPKSSISPNLPFVGFPYRDSSPDFTPSWMRGSGSKGGRVSLMSGKVKALFICFTFALPASVQRRSHGPAKARIRHGVSQPVRTSQDNHEVDPEGAGAEQSGERMEAEQVRIETR